MKNIIRTAVYAAVSLVSLFCVVSCSSDLDEIAKPSTGGNNPSASGITKLNASISQEESMATKAVLGQKGSDGVYPISWQSGDKIAVSNTQAAPSVFSAESAGAQTSFSLTSGDPINAKTTQAVSALYPAGMVTGFTAGKYVVDLPKVQKYTSGTFDQNAYLMGAYATVSESSPNPNLEFKSLCSVLDLQVTSSYDTRVKRIVISSTSPLSGKGEVTLNDGTKELNMASDANTSVTLDCGETGVELKKGVVKNFYVVLPADTYLNLSIKVEDFDGKYQIFNNKSNISLKKAMLAPVTLKVTSIPVLKDATVLRDAMKSAASSIENITKVVFEVNSSKTSGTRVNVSESSAPIYVSYEDGTITFSTPASMMKAGARSFSNGNYYYNGLFYNNANLTEIEGLENIDTSDVTNMKGMFYGCSSLSSLNMSSFNTAKVTTMASMFDNCTKLTSLNIDGFNTSNVTDMSNMFGHCFVLSSLNVSKFNTSKVTDMSFMFGSCHALTSLDVSNFRTSSVTNMKNMFLSCNGLSSLDLSNFDTSKVTDMSGMFSGCECLTSLKIDKFNTSEVKNMMAMFQECKSFTTLDLSNFVTTSVTNMSYMFHSCEKVTSINLSNAITSKVTNMMFLFYNCKNLSSVDLSKFEITDNSGARYMFDGVKDNARICCTKAVEDYLKNNKLSPSRAIFVRP